MNAESFDPVEAHPHISKQLQQMVDVEQNMRERSQEENTWDETVDIQNTEQMKQLIATIGWPSISKVGAEGSENAWLLVQHADLDVEFQSLCLNLMKDVPLYDIDPTNIAYLEDRVCVNTGAEQVYGTQFRQVDGRHVPLPIRDIDQVDARRAAMGMDPLQAQIDSMYEAYPFDTNDS